MANRGLRLLRRSSGAWVIDDSCTTFIHAHTAKTACKSELNFARYSVSPRQTVKIVDIYVYMIGRRRGPYDKPRLEEMWNRGQIPADTLYWHDGMPRWAVISDLFAADLTIARSLVNGHE